MIVKKADKAANSTDMSAIPPAVQTTDATADANAIIPTIDFAAYIIPRML